MTRFLRRKAASQHIEEHWGVPCSEKTLAKLAVVGGGPVFRKVGRFPVYERPDLDDWVASRIGARMRSTSVESDDEWSKYDER